HIIITIGSRLWSGLSRPKACSVVRRYKRGRKRGPKPTDTRPMVSRLSWPGRAEQTHKTVDYIPAGGSFFFSHSRGFLGPRPRGRDRCHRASGRDEPNVGPLFR